MLMIVYFKREEGGSEKVTYGIELEEFKRLSGDYESYLKTGDPKEGWYKCSTAHGDTSIKIINRVLFNFDQIAAIG